ncbi:ketosteroid isomerase-like protein [Janthinobacterium sp. CG_23.3]|uniref:YybH family protein n=1 Tax=Janthinobacterium sp. CG_23.3 TaxID=3349634 RepID=UPI0038D3574F
MTEVQHQANMEQVRHLLLSWASATRTDERSKILKNHHPDSLIFDVLQPTQYAGTEAYRASWDSWQPETQGDNVFEFTDLNVVTGEDVAFASGLIRCGGTLKDGKSFEDLVRATFCLQNLSDKWTVMHQHISKPMGK